MATDKTYTYSALRSADGKRLPGGYGAITDDDTGEIVFPSMLINEARVRLGAVVNNI